MNRTTIIKTKHLYIGGISVFLVGLILGAVLLLVNFQFVMHAFRPEPHKMAEILATRVTDNLSEDFEISEVVQNNIKNIVISSQPRIDMIFKSIHQELGTFRDGLIKRVAEEIPNVEDRSEFLADPDKYFPTPPKGGPPPPPPPH